MLELLPVSAYFMAQGTPFCEFFKRIFCILLFAIFLAVICMLSSGKILGSCTVQGSMQFALHGRKMTMTDGEQCRSSVEPILIPGDGRGRGELKRP